MQLPNIDSISLGPSLAPVDGGLGFLAKRLGQQLAALPAHSQMVADQAHNDQPLNLDSRNIYISGDNLEGLKHLLLSHAGTIKCIYIDPPYNTGSADFAYNDKFSFTPEQLSSLLEIDISQAVKLHNSASRASLSHAAWLAFMYPRLLLARELLSDDGVIFISIGDEEQSHLRLLGQEVFGETNALACFVVEKTQHFGRQKQNCYSNVDYVLCFAKSGRDTRRRNLLVERVKGDLLDAPLYNASNNLATLQFPADSVEFRIPDGQYAAACADKYELLDPVLVTNGRNTTPFRMRFRSRWSSQTVIQQIAMGTTFLVKSTSFAIRAKYSPQKQSLSAPRQLIFTNRNNPMCTVSRFGRRVDTSEKASAELQALMGRSVFSYPKPSTLVEYLLSLLYDQELGEFCRDYWVLDFFSGSATSAQAVLQLNALDQGQRRFIMIQTNETAQASKLCSSSQPVKLDELGQERIIRASARIRQEYPQANIDWGFKHYWLQGK